MASADKMKYIHALLNDTRVSIIVSLFTKAKNISDLMKEPPIKEVDRSTLCYHLNILEDVGLVKSNYVILEAPHSKGRAGRVYQVDRKQLAQVIKAMDEFKKELSAK